MATLSDAVQAMEYSGCWISDERTQITTIFQALDSTSINWNLVKGQIEFVTSQITLIASELYDKLPRFLTDEEILAIRDTMTAEEWASCVFLELDVSSSGKYIEAIYDDTDGYYSFSLEDLAAGILAVPAVIVYIQPVGSPKRYASATTGLDAVGGYEITLTDSLLPEVAVGGEWRGWFPSQDKEGVSLRAGDTIFAAQVATAFGTYEMYRAEVFEGIATEQTEIQMRTKQMINGAIQEFLVYPKTQGGGGSGGSDLVIWNEQSVTEIGNEVAAILDAGAVPKILHVADASIFYLVNGASDAFLFVGWGVDPPNVISNWMMLINDGGEWQMMTLTATWEATMVEG